MKWLTLLALSCVLWATSDAGDVHIHLRFHRVSARADKNTSADAGVAPYSPANCPEQEYGYDYVGNDLNVRTGLSQEMCCDECSKTDGCTAYTWYFEKTGARLLCSLKSSDAGRQPASGAVSGKFDRPTPPPLWQCPDREENVDYYGHDIRNIHGISHEECCAVAIKEPSCAGYTFVEDNGDGQSACYLKKSTAGRREKNGAISAHINWTPPPPPPPPTECPVQEKDVDYYGNDITSLHGVSQSACCDACGTTQGCKAYTYIDLTPDGQAACYLKSSADGKQARRGAVSGKRREIEPIPRLCPRQETDIVYGGDDLRVVPDISNTECCNECGRTPGCAAYSLTADLYSGATTCYLKHSVGDKNHSPNTISATYLPTPPPPPPPPSLLCPIQEEDVDYYGNDIKPLYGVTIDKCCVECGNTHGCNAYTFVAQNPDGKTACYLKRSSAGKVAKAGAVSAELKPLPRGTASSGSG